jgi:4-amino-4-deoxy-L-arabinose transferase-like glycosyltransferase
VAQHGALPAYSIRASGLIFGNTLRGWRMASVIAGTLTVLLIFAIGRLWWGPGPGLIAAWLLAVERYHVEISARAIDLPFDLLFVTAALYAFARFLKSIQEPTPAWPWLYATAAACGFGFLCKEFTALLLPTLLLSLVFMGRIAWIGRRQPWIACAVFLAVISPDLYSNLTVTPEKRLELWQRHQQAAEQTGAQFDGTVYTVNGLYMSYGDQLSRFRGIGFNAEPFYFYFGSLLDALGVKHQNTFSEFPFMHPLEGILLWCGLASALWRRPKDSLTVALLTMFLVLFVPFSLVQLGEPRARFPSDPKVLWYWVDRTMLPAMLLTGHACWQIWSRGRSAPRRLA